MPTEPSPIEAAKRRAAYRAVSEHFTLDMTHIGIGSGTTIQYGVDAILDRLSSTSSDDPSSHRYFIPTGSASKKMIEAAGLQVMTYDNLPDGVTLDVAFDGADEVDSELNCIKGGGACLFQEKLVAMRAREFVVIADWRKDQERLLSEWQYVPIEVAPIASRRVIDELKDMGATKAELRRKDGEVVKTDQGLCIVDAGFKVLLNESDVDAGRDGSDKEGGIWAVSTLAQRIKAVTGVLEVGLFYGPDGVDAGKDNGQGGQRPVAAYFGTRDGEVTVRNRQR